jgi:hypothetical protein
MPLFSEMNKFTMYSTIIKKKRLCCKRYAIIRSLRLFVEKMNMLCIYYYSPASRPSHTPRQFKSSQLGSFPTVSAADTVSVEIDNASMEEVAVKLFNRKLLRLSDTSFGINDESTTIEDEPDDIGDVHDSE